MGLQKVLLLRLMTVRVHCTELQCNDLQWGPSWGDCVDNCTISATDVTWVWKHLTQGFFCQLFCVCRTQRTKDLNLLLFSTRLAKAHRFKVCLKYEV